MRNCTKSPKKSLKLKRFAYVLHLERRINNVNKAKDTNKTPDKADRITITRLTFGWLLDDETAPPFRTPNVDACVVDRVISLVCGNPVVVISCFFCFTIVVRVGFILIGAGGLEVGLASVTKE